MAGSELDPETIEFLDRLGKSSAIAADHLSNISDSTKSATPGLIAWGNAVKQSKTGLINWDGTVGKSGKSLKGFAGTIQSASQKLENSIKGLMNGEGSLEGFVGAVGSGAGQLVSSFGNLAGSVASVGGYIPIIGDVGKALGSLGEGALVAATAVFTGAMGFAGRIVDVNKQIMQTGIGMDTGFQGIMNAASDAGVDLKSFSQAILENSDSLRMMAGGAPGGIKAISKAFKALPSAADLLSLGYTQEQILGTIADTAATINLTGKAIDAQGLAKQTDRYLRTQMELTRLTGVNIKQAKDNIDQANTNAFLQSTIMDADAEHAAALKNIIGTFGEANASMFIRGGAFNDETGLFQSQFPKLTSALTEYTQKVQSGTYPLEQAQKELEAQLKEQGVSEEAKKAIKTWQGAALGGSEQARAVTATANMALRMNEAAIAGENLYKGVGKANEAMTSFEEMNLKFQAMMFFVGSSLFKLFGGSAGGLASIMSLSLEKLQEGAGLYARSMTESGPEIDAAIEKFKKDTGADLKTILGGVTDSLGSLGSLAETIATAIHTGFEEIDWSKVSNALFGKGEYQSENDANPLMQGGLRTVDTLLKPVVDTILPKWLESDKGLYDLWYGLHDLANMPEIVQPARKGVPINQVDPTLNFPDLAKPSDPSQYLGPGKMDGWLSKWIMGQAHGDAWSPKSGGRIVRIAEAGFHEATVPLARVGGDMGVKVTGDLIDGSRTMPALLQAVSELNQQVASLRSMTLEQNRIMDRQLSTAKVGVMLSS